MNCCTKKTELLKCCICNNPTKNTNFGNIYKADSLRNGKINIPQGSGCYKWWANEQSLQIIINKLIPECLKGKEKEYLELLKSLMEVSCSKNDKEPIYCIYVGKTGSNLHDRFNQHIRVNNTDNSTFQKSISAILEDNKTNNSKTIAFIEGLYFQWSNQITNINSYEKCLINQRLRVLNLICNYHCFAQPLKNKLNCLRESFDKKSKHKCKGNCTR